MDMNERISRNATEDQIFLGETIERALSGDFGFLLKALIEGIRDEYLYISEKQVTLPADRTLGRLEALNKIQERLDSSVRVMRELKEELKSEKMV